MNKYINVNERRINIGEINYYIPRQSVSKKDKNVKEYVINIYFKNNDSITLFFNDEGRRNDILSCLDYELGVMQR
ncbi:MAG: hypothetical protein LBI28_01090 [Treponema sp.]|jgi:uncharacterized protein affecting Mg2+/Co2+ transport|nr:hypothetical protein [Treponema sp.]